MSSDDSCLYLLAKNNVSLRSTTAFAQDRIFKLGLNLPSPEEDYIHNEGRWDGLHSKLHADS